MPVGGGAAARFAARRSASFAAFILDGFGEKRLARVGGAVGLGIGMGALAATSFTSEIHNRHIANYPKTFSATGFGAGFGAHGRRMPFDGGIGATGDIVLQARTHGNF